MDLGFHRLGRARFGLGLGLSIRPIPLSFGLHNYSNIILAQKFIFSVNNRLHGILFQKLGQKIVDTILKIINKSVLVNLRYNLIIRYNLSYLDFLPIIFYIRVRPRPGFQLFLGIIYIFRLNISNKMRSDL